MRVWQSNSKTSIMLGLSAVIHGRQLGVGGMCKAKVLRPPDG